MRILVTGAAGFIGTQIVSELEKHGHTVIRGVRKKPLNDIENKFIYCDFNQDIQLETWQPKLQHIDIVINAAGILQGSRHHSIEAIQTLTPQALFKASEKMGIKRIIHISALGADEAAKTEYAFTKKASEDYLRTLEHIDWVILRPSLVFATGSYGGTSLMRGMAATPFFIGVPGKENPSFQPIFIEDLAKAVRILCEKKERLQTTLDITGTEQIPIRELLLTLRKWLGFKKAFILPVPLWAIKLFTKIGDKLGGPLNSTSLTMMLYGNTTTPEKMQHCREIIGFSPAGFTETLRHLPSYVQDRWHARLYFVRPVLKIVLALFWVGFIVHIALWHFHWLELWAVLPALVATFTLFIIYSDR